MMASTSSDEAQSPADVVADRQRSRPGEDRQKAALLEVDAAVLVLSQVAEDRQGRAPAARRRRQHHRKARLAPGLLDGVVEDPVGQRRIAMDGHAVEEDVDIQQIRWLGMLDPAIDYLAPDRRAVATPGILGHDAAAAIGHADLVERIGHVLAELGEGSTRTRFNGASG